MFIDFINTDFLLVAFLSLSLILIALEIIIPSFGLLGILGIYLFIESVLSLKKFDNIWTLILISVVVSGIAIWIIFKLFVKNSDRNKLVLNTSLKETKGSGSNEAYLDLVGKQGHVHKTLRPAGNIMIDGEVYEARSYGNYIEKDAKVVVDKVESNVLFVKPI